MRPDIPRRACEEHDRRADKLDRLALRRGHVGGVTLDHSRDLRNARAERILCVRVRGGVHGCADRAREAGDRWVFEDDVGGDVARGEAELWVLGRAEGANDAVTEERRA